MRAYACNDMCILNCACTFFSTRDACSHVPPEATSSHHHTLNRRRQEPTRTTKTGGRPEEPCLAKGLGGSLLETEDGAALLFAAYPRMQPWPSTDRRRFCPNGTCKMDRRSSDQRSGKWRRIPRIPDEPSSNSAHGRWTSRRCTQLRI